MKCTSLRPSPMAYKIQVSQFIKVKDVVKVSVATKKYIERAKRYER
ncbi:MAG: hypothetical protein ABSG71_19690 [Thermodesulfobacteriota bacterium]